MYSAVLPLNVRVMVMHRDDPGNQDFPRRVQRPWLRFLMLAPFAAGMVILAGFFLVTFIVILAVFMLGFAARIWWLRRKIGAGMRSPGAARAQPLDGEFSVVRENKDSEQQRLRR
ncbi:MAG: hypothetical protein ACYDDO_07260 [Acidiferrobacterales bacterium]